MENEIIAEMIKALTNNKLVLVAVEKALSNHQPNGVKFTSLVRNNLPEIVGDESGFCFDETPETEAHSALVNAEIIIDRETSGELDVKSIEQITKYLK